MYDGCQSDTVEFTMRRVHCVALEDNFLLEIPILHICASIILIKYNTKAY